MAIKMEIYAEIRRLRSEGVSIRQTAKKLNVSRQIVRKYQDGEIMPGPECRKQVDRQPTVMTEEVIQFIKECLEYDRTTQLRKQKHTAKRIYDRLKEERGFTGSYESVKKHVVLLKAEYVPPKADLPLRFQPGEAMQVDFGQAKARIQQKMITIHYFCARLCYSCAIYVYAGLSENTETFLESIENAFYFFGGVPNQIIFDNGSAAVRDGYGKKAIATDKYRLMAGHYIFETVFCNPGSGNEKGLVENLVGYSRNNFMVPIPEAESIDDLNKKFEGKCRKYINEHKVEGRTATVKEQYETELKHMKKPAPYRFDTSRIAFPKPNDFSLIRFDNNQYSIPVQFSTLPSVTLKASALKVRIFNGKKEIAVHDRLYGKNQTSYKLEHYIDEIKRKPRAVFRAEPVLYTVEEELLEFGKHLPEKDKNKHMVHLLTMVVEYGEEPVLNIIRRQKGSSLSIDMIRAQLESKESANKKTNLEVRASDPSVFDRKWLA